MADNDPLQFDFRPLDNPGSVTCPGCRQTVSLPKNQPWIVIGGVAHPPSGLMSFPCPNCRTRIYLMEVDEERRRYDAEQDAQRNIEKPIEPEDQKGS